MIRDKLIDHKHYIVEHGEDMPEVVNWKWQYYSGSNADKSQSKTTVELTSDKDAIAAGEMDDSTASAHS